MTEKPSRRSPVNTEQMQARDRIEFEFCRQKGLPLLFVLAGGYQEPIREKLLPLQLNTFRAAQEIWQK